MGRLGVAAAFALAVFVVGVGMAGPAAADDGLTDAEYQFLMAVESQGYPPNGQTVDVGYRACSLLDDEVQPADVDRFVADTYADTRDGALFYAALFNGYAAYRLCPRHMDKYGSV